MYLIDQNHQSPPAREAREIEGSPAPQEADPTHGITAARCGEVPVPDEVPPIEDAPMLMTAREPQARLPEWKVMRCSCNRCGAHVIARMAMTLGGECGNCGSYDLSVIGPEPASPLVLAPLLAARTDPEPACP